MNDSVHTGPGGRWVTRDQGSWPQTRPEISSRHHNSHQGRVIAITVFLPDMDPW